MSEFNYTVSQRQAVESRNENLLVSAAAGSGKTMVLVDRIIKIVLEEKVDLTSMLIVTFTKAAANQMVDKIRFKLEEALSQERADAIFLHRQLKRLNMAQISTMHAFCIEELRRYFHVLGIEPNFRIVNTSGEAVLRQEAMNEVLEAEYLKGKEDFMRLLEGYGGRNGSELPLLIDEIYNKIQTRIDPIGWLEGQIEEMKENLLVNSDSNLVNSITEYIRSEIRDALSMTETAITLAQQPEGPGQYLDALESDIESLEELMDIANDKGYDAMINKLASFRFTSLKVARNVDEKLKNTVKSLRDDSKGIIKKLNEKFSGKSLERIKTEQTLALDYIITLNRLIKEFDRLFVEKKVSQRCLNFSDVEHQMIRLLCDEEVRIQISNRIKYIFFDEYQDINPLQESIINALKGDNNLFFVGDIKQSIYSFRLSDPKLFADRYHNYSREGTTGRLIELSHNFRSSPKILEFCNFIFESLMTPELGDIDYNEGGQKLIAGREANPNETGVSLVLTEDKGQRKAEDLNPNALYISREIERLICEDGYDYRDIVVLVRSVRSKVEDYENVFSLMGIPYFSDISRVKLTDIEVSTFIDMLRVVNNEVDDRALIVSMLSVLGGFSEEELAYIRSENPEGSFYNAYMETVNNPLSQNDKLMKFRSALKNYRLALSRMTLSDFVYYFAKDSGYLNYLEALNDGSSKLENLKAFFDRVEEYEQVSLTGLIGLLKYVDKLLKSPGEGLEPTQLLGEQDNVVRIMSIHKSKGLEFPIVFISETQTSFNYSDMRKKYVIDPSMGVGLKVADLDMGIIYNTSLKLLIEEKMKRQIKSEEVRLLYVAMTRAIERLYLVGAVKDPDEYIDKLSSIPKGIAIRKSDKYLDWIFAIVVNDLSFNACIDNYDSNLDSRIKRNTVKKKYRLLKYPYMPPTECRETKIRQNIDSMIDDVDLTIEDIEGYERVFKYIYPNLRAASLPYKKTVSELSKRVQIDTGDLAEFPRYFDYSKKETIIGDRLPKFLQSTAVIGPGERGSIVHTVFQNISLMKHDHRTVREELNRMVVQDILTKEESAVVDIGTIVDFFSSDLGLRLIENRLSARRETSFTMAYENIYVDGQIDCYFIENGEVVLFDFKTDAAISRHKYFKQLEFYSKAVEKATGYRVKERLIYWTEHKKSTAI